MADLDDHIALLWAEVRANPRERAPRRVLADALMERGDPRGELIAVQCADGDAGGDEDVARRLVHEHGARWLGNLAPVLSELGTEFSGGMLEVIRVGKFPAPPQFTGRNAELATVHTVRPGHVRSRDYAELLACPDLANVTTVAVDTGLMIAELAALRPIWPFRTIEYTVANTADHARQPELADTFAQIAELAPDLEHFVLQDAMRVLPGPDRFGALRRLLALIVPRARKLRRFLIRERLGYVRDELRPLCSQIVEIEDV